MHEREVVKILNAILNELNVLEKQYEAIKKELAESSRLKIIGQLRSRVSFYGVYSAVSRF